MNKSQPIWLVIVLIIVVGISLLWIENSKRTESQLGQISKDELKPYSFRILEEDKEGVKEIELLTRQKTIIRATDYGGNFSNNVILLHMANRTRKDYDNFAHYLSQNNMRVMSLDFRGHGDSEGDRKTFTYADYEQMTRDVETAHKYLTNVTNNEQIFIIGSELGANVASNYRYGKVSKLILISPLKDISGIESEQVYAFKIPILMIGSSGDKEVVDNIKELEEEISKQSAEHGFTKTIILPGDERGTSMLKDSELRGEIVSFLLA